MNYDNKMIQAGNVADDADSKGGDYVPLSNEPHSMVDAHSVRAREEERTQLRADIDAFLAQGGKVETLAANCRADLPRAPQNNYGKGSI